MGYNCKRHAVRSIHSCADCAEDNDMLAEMCDSDLRCLHKVDDNGAGSNDARHCND